MSEMTRKTFRVRLWIAGQATAEIVTVHVEHEFQIQARLTETMPSFSWRVLGYEEVGVTDSDLLNIARSIAADVARCAHVEGYEEFATTVRQEYMNAVAQRFTGVTAESLENLLDDIDTQELFTNR